MYFAQLSVDILGKACDRSLLSNSHGAPNVCLLTTSFLVVVD